jgi:SNF2 family DNA or RNA helicase
MSYASKDMVKKKAAHSVLKKAAAKKKREDMQKKRAAEEDSEKKGENNVEEAPKILALLEKIEKHQEKEKAVIFSQFTSYLDIISDSLTDAGYNWTRIDGTMTIHERCQAMQEFQSEDESSPRFILCSLHACGTGITLTSASVVFMMDVW